MKLDYDDERLISVILNHRFPFHNVRKMMEHATVQLHLGTGLGKNKVVVTVDDQVVEECAPSGKQFPWS